MKTLSYKLPNLIKNMGDLSLDMINFFQFALPAFYFSVNAGFTCSSLISLRKGRITTDQISVRGEFINILTTPSQYVIKRFYKTSSS